MDRVIGNVAIISTPGAILLNVESFLGNMQLINLVLAIVVSTVSIISLCFIIRKNYFAAKHEKLEALRIERELNKT